MAIGQERLAALNAAKLRTLTRGRVGDDAAPGALPGGAGLVDGATAWVLLGADAAHSLGAALAWSHRRGAETVNVVVDDPGAAGLLARRALPFAPAPTIWRADGAALAAVAPTPVPALRPVPGAEDLRSLLAEAGLDAVDEDGAILGELLGLEVARITTGEDGPVLDVGVGRFDREMTVMTHAHLAPADRLHRAVEIVAQHRRPDAPPHPLNQLVPERWMRAALVADPSRIGVAALRPVASAVGRANLKDTAVASAVGLDTAGEPVVVTCSTGVDLDLVPAAADDRAARAEGARLILAVPARDALPLTRDLAARLAHPADVVGLDGEWRIPWV
ncbi:MAG TPA: hypothetical protein VGO60_03050 [Iamia sp.]|jgi:hypothetical protein|nr:hypothetical protein [Iamia sp.]